MKSDSVTNTISTAIHGRASADASGPAGLLRRHALALVAVAVLTSVLTVAFTSRVMRAEKRDHLQRATEQGAETVASQLRGDMQHLFQALTDIGSDREHRGDPSRAMEFDSDLLGVSVWSRQANTLVPTRILQTTNRRYVTPIQEGYLHSPRIEAMEREQTFTAFDGKTALSVTFSVDPAGILMVSMPLVHASPPEVLVAHLRLERFQRGFRTEGMTHFLLLTPEGSIIANSDEVRPDGRETLKSQGLFPLFQEYATSGLSVARFRYLDGRGEQQLGYFQRIGDVPPLVIFARVADFEANPRTHILVVTGAFYALIYLALIIAMIFFLGDGGALAGHEASRDAHGDSTRPDLAHPGVQENSGTLAGLPSSRGTSEVSSGPGSEDHEPEITSSSLTRGTRGSEPFADRRVVVVLHGTIINHEELMKAPDPRELATVFNEWFRISATMVEFYGGVIEKDAGGSFMAIWGAKGSSRDAEEPRDSGDPDDLQNDSKNNSKSDSKTRQEREHWNAIRCALELRRAFGHLNESLKTDGLTTVVYGMGVDSGMALAARLGPEPRQSVVGEVLACARKLGTFTKKAGSDILISGEVWQVASNGFLGEKLGEAKLTESTGLKDYYGVVGYLDERCVEIFVNPADFSANPAVEKLVAPDEAAPGGESTSFIVPLRNEGRWLVNNGSQIVGPLSAPEIAQRLFTQELDFDSECWVEGSGNPAKIREAGLFSASHDENADLWVYDGTTVHGPVTLGFLRTAIAHGAIGADGRGAYHVCERSTVNGWIPLKAWSETMLNDPSPVDSPEAESAAGTDINKDVQKLAG